MLTHQILLKTLLSTKLETLLAGVEITIGRRGGGKPNVCNLGFSGYRFAIVLGIGTGKLYLNCLE